MKSDTMDAVFHALAHAGRRRMLDIVRSHPGCHVGELCEHFEMSRVGAMKHLRVLEEAGLVLSRKEGRVRQLYVNAAPLQLIHDRWVTDWSAVWAEQLAGIKHRVEAAGTSGQHQQETG